MSIREYSMTRDSTRQLSPSFRVREFACKGSDVVLIDDALVVMLRRGSENVIPNGDTAIQAGDLMVLSTPLCEDDDGVSLREVPVAEHGDWIGRPIKELGIPAEVLIVLVRRADGTTVVPKGGTVLQQGDMLVVNEWEET